MCKYATKETLNNIHKLVARQVAEMKVNPYEKEEQHQMPMVEDPAPRNVFFDDVTESDDEDDTIEEEDTNLVQA